MATSKTAQKPQGLTVSQEAGIQISLRMMGIKDKKVTKQITQKLAGTNAVKLNRFTTQFIKVVKKVDRKTTDIVQGVPGDLGAQKLNPLKYGLLPLIELISSIDLCNIINYLVDQVDPGGKKFNPNDTTQRDTALGRSKYKLQYAAYRIQGYIDNYYSVTSDINNLQNPENKSKAQDVIIKIVQEFRNLTETTDQVFNNPELNNAFPQLSTYNNFLTIANTFFNQYTDLRNVPTGEEFQKILRYIDKTRSTCILIQGLDKPRDLIAFADTFLGGKVSEQLQRLQKLIDPKKIESVIKDIQRGVNTIYKAIQSLLVGVNIIRSILTIANLLIKVFFIIVNFLKLLPVPSIFATVGVHNTIGDATAGIKEQIKKFTDVLYEINRILSVVYFFCQRRVIEFGQMLNLLQVVRINLQNCDLGEDSQTKNNIDEAIKDLESVVNSLNNYTSIYDNNTKKRKKRIGEYTIQILTEEVVDEGISLRRRYGVALNNKDIVVAKSVPTFATDDNVIIEEVKLLLPKTKTGNLIPNEFLDIMNETSNYLDTDEPIDQTVIIEEPEEAEEDSDSEDDEPASGLGLQGFINKLKGGKKLRRRMRRETAKSKRNLANELNAADPKSNKSKKAEIDALKAELDVLTDNLKAAERKLEVTIAASITNPVLRPVVIVLRKDVKEIQKQIKDKENQIKEKEKQITG